MMIILMIIYDNIDHYKLSPWFIMIMLMIIILVMIMIIILLVNIDADDGNSW